MALTLRNDAKTQIIKLLRKQGYPTYGRLVDYFDIYLSDDPEVIGYMIPGQAKIVLNKDLNINQVSTIVRHEILHEYLVHGPRQEKFDKAHPELNPHLAPHDISNIAADYEISNRGYTDDDKVNIKHIKLNDKVLRGLVTEDEHPDWVNLSYEEMYQKLLEQDAEDRQAMQNIIDQLSKLTKKDIEDMEQDASANSSKPEDNTSKNPQTNSASKNDTSTNIKPEDNSQSKGASSDKLEQDKQQQAAQDAVEKLKDDFEDAQQKSERSEEVFDTPEEQKEKADIVARAQAIRDFINNMKEKQAITDETSAAIRREKQSKEAADVERYQGKGLNQFKLNLNRFISDQLSEIHDDSYARIHPSYEDGEFIVPGKLVREDKLIPLINVYHDNSGSFDDPKKTEAAIRALNTLNQYVRDGDIEIKLYYFGNKVSDTRSGTGGGTEGTPILDHIEQTKPTNVIVITDSDISDCRRTVTVPGAVWMLFYDSRSNNLMEHLKGKRQNKYYDITY